MPQKKRNNYVQADGDVVIYGIIDSRDGLVHYVGQSTDYEDRKARHLNPSVRTGNGLGEAYKLWRKELDEACGWIEFITLEIITVERIEEALECEAAWIHNGRKAGWPLVNRFLARMMNYPVKDVKLFA